MILIILPFTPEHVSGGSIYNRHLVAALSTIYEIEVKYIQDNFPYPSNNAKIRIEEIIKINPHLLIIDGIMSKPLSEIDHDIPTIIIVHNKLTRGQQYTSEQEIQLTRIEDKIASSALAIITPSKQWYEQTTRSNVHLLYPGCDGPFNHTQAISYERKSRQLLSVANLSEIKNLSFALKVLSHLEDYTLVIIGKFIDSDYECKIKHLIKDYQLKEKVIFCGQLDQADLVQFYYESTFYIVTSLHESFSISVGEALYAGLPVIMPDLPIPDFLKKPSSVVNRDVDEFVAKIRYLGKQDQYQNLSKHISKLKSSLPTWSQMEAQARHIIGDYLG